MAVNYEIPWQPPNLLPGMNMLISTMQESKRRRLAEENAETQRLFANRNMSIASAREKREEAEFKAREADRQHKLEVERSQQLGPLGAVARRMSPEFASEMGKPYGISFSQGQPQGHVQNPLAGADYGQHAQQTLSGAAPVDTARLTGEASAGLMPGEEGPEVNPYASALRFPGTEAPPAPPMEGPEYDPIAMESERLSRIQRPLLVNVAGRSFDLPEMQGGNPFGADYDDLYDRLLTTPGITPEEAVKFVATQYKADQTQKAIGDRAAESLRARDARTEDQQAFLSDLASKYRLTFEQRKELAEIMNRGRMAAAGATTSPFLPEVLRSVEEGAPLSETAEIAAKRNIPSKAYAPLAGAVVRNAATANTAQNQRAGLEVTDSRGNVLGFAHNTTQANQLKKQTDQFAQAQVRLHELIEDIEKQGSRVLTPEQIQQRLSKAESVNAAMRVYNGLGATDASQALEARITGAIGTPGHGFLMGANASIIKRILHEAEMQHDSRVKTALRAGGGPQLAPALGGRRQSGGGGGGMITIRNKKTGETKQVTREEAQRMGAL